MIERPDFHLTSDLRATSDPLWRDLAKFRRWLMEGGSYTPAQWQSVLIDIRMAAHNAGLRPCLGKIEYIVSTLAEARAGFPEDIWSKDPDSWSKVVMIACGEHGWIEEHDLLDGFASTEPQEQGKRAVAIGWAESWMNARERQLCGTVAATTPVATAPSPGLSERGHLPRTNTLAPHLARQELQALRYLAKHENWGVGLDTMVVSVWAVERMDRRGWVHAQEVDLLGGDLPHRYQPRGPWFRPTQNRLGDGHPDWPSIITKLKYTALPKPQRIYARMALTEEGSVAARDLSERDVIEPDAVEQVAQALEHVSAEWRRGDAEMTDLAAVMGTETGGFEKLMGPVDGERAVLCTLVAELRTTLVPRLTSRIDASLRDDIRKFVQELNPQTVGRDQYDEVRERWRHTWAALGYQSRADELVAMLRAVGLGEKPASPSVPHLPRTPTTLNSRLTSFPFGICSNAPARPRPCWSQTGAARALRRSVTRSGRFESGRVRKQ